MPGLQGAAKTCCTDLHGLGQEKAGPTQTSEPGAFKCIHGKGSPGFRNGSPIHENTPRMHACSRPAAVTVTDDKGPDMPVPKEKAYRSYSLNSLEGVI